MGIITLAIRWWCYTRVTMDENITTQTPASTKDNKKLIIALVLVALVGGYIVFGQRNSSTEVGVNNAELDAQLAELQRNNPEASSADLSYDGTDQRNVSIGSGGGSEANSSVFRTDSPVVRGVVVGYGTKTDSRGEYLVAYIRVSETEAYEVDLRNITGYSMNRPAFLTEGNIVRVYGTLENGNEIRADAVQ